MFGLNLEITPKRIKDNIEKVVEGPHTGARENISFSQCKFMKELLLNQFSFLFRKHKKHT